MREILYRGKRMDNGEWAEGSLLIDEIGGCYIGTYLPMYQTTYICQARRSGKILNRFRGIGLVKVIPKTVGQYTGLTDKNGTKIFEGDIAKNIDGVFLVCWDKEKCAFVMRFLEYPYETLYLEEMWEDSEVIGNIHDNPELLEVSENG